MIFGFHSLIIIIGLLVGLCNIGFQIFFFKLLYTHCIQTQFYRNFTKKVHICKHTTTTLFLVVIVKLILQLSRSCQGNRSNNPYQTFVKEEEAPKKRYSPDNKNLFCITDWHSERVLSILSSREIKYANYKGEHLIENRKNHKSHFQIEVFVFERYFFNSCLRFL